MKKTAAIALALVLFASPVMAAKKTPAAKPKPPVAAPAPVPAAPKPANEYEQKIMAHPFYKDMMEVAQQKRGRELLQYFDEALAVDATRLPVISYWLRLNSIDMEDPEKINSLYFLSYSDTLSAMAEGYRAGGDPEQYRGLYKTAMLNLHIFEIMGTVDAARCQDPTAKDAVKAMLSDRLDGIRTAYKMFPRDIIEQVEKSALRQEEKYLSRPANTDICSLGQARIIDLSKTAGVTEKKIQDPRFPGGVRVVYVPPAGYTYDPAIVPDDEWLKLRRQALGSVTKDWAKRYEDASR